MSKKYTRPVLFTVGTLCIILGTVGIVLPVLPTTPFLLAAATCYAKSSDKFHNWLIDHRWFGSYIRDFRSGNGIPLRTKIIAIATLWVSITCSAMFIINITIARIIMFLIASGVTIYILSIPTSSKKLH